MTHAEGQSNRDGVSITRQTAALARQIKARETSNLSILLLVYIQKQPQADILPLRLRCHASSKNGAVET